MIEAPPKHLPSECTLAQLAAEDLDGTVTVADVDRIRRQLAADLAGLTSDWDRPSPGLLRINKARIRTAAICAAQVVGELQSLAMNAQLALGVACDIAAGLVAVHPDFDAHGAWYRSIEHCIDQERPEVADFVRSMAPNDRSEFETEVDDRCAGLRALLGSLPEHRPTVRERATVEFPDAGVLLTAEIDLVVGDPARIVAEIKSGSWQSWLASEIRHYGLVMALRDAKPPRQGCSVTLADRALTPIALDADALELAAKDVTRAAQVLIDVDRSVANGKEPPTSPGNHCLWCRRARTCPDVSDLVLAELEGLRHADEWGDDDDGF